jgi:hypothetical protein
MFVDTCISSYLDNPDNQAACREVVERIQEQVRSISEDFFKKAQEIGCAASTTRWTSLWNPQLSAESAYKRVDFTDCFTKVDACHAGCDKYGSWTVADCANEFNECGYNACQYYNSLDGNDYSGCKASMSDTTENILKISDAAFVAYNNGHQQAQCPF